MRRLLLAPLLALALAGCGDDGDDTRATGAGPAEGDDASLADAPERMSRERASFSLAATLEAEGLDDPVDLGAEGVVDFPADRSRMELDFAEILELGGAGSASDWRGEAVYQGDVIFIRLPGLTKALPERVDWLEVDAGTLAEQGGTQFNAPDPVEFVGFVEALGEDVEKLGEEDVRGTETDHYRGTVAVADLPRAARAEDRAQLAAYARRIRTGGLESFPLDVWIDDEGRIRRLRVEYDGLSTGAASVSLATSVEFYDFGVDATIEPPPRAKVTPFGELIGRGAEETKHSEE
jgi:hypothetical protein